MNVWLAYVPRISRMTGFVNAATRKVRRNGAHFDPRPVVSLKCSCSSIIASPQRWLLSNNFFKCWPKYPPFNRTLRALT